ncbi:MAG: double-stranded beta-helix domain-containing protein, partial [Deltaproteobacteria bacterium]|nr:double-stranded beta-helix domain-containing protein [Deltaproteobacteria bacterium]
LRQINGLAQADLAERAGLTKGAISQVERNLTSPSVANLFEILTALNETPSSFFADVDEEKVLFRKSDALPSEVTGYKSFDTLLPKSRYRSIVAYRATIAPGKRGRASTSRESRSSRFRTRGRRSSTSSGCARAEDDVGARPGDPPRTRGTRGGSWRPIPVTTPYR